MRRRFRVQIVPKTRHMARFSSVFCPDSDLAGKKMPANAGDLRRQRVRNTELNELKCHMARRQVVGIEALCSRFLPFTGTGDLWQALGERSARGGSVGAGPVTVQATLRGRAHRPVLQNPRCTRGVPSRALSRMRGSVLREPEGGSWGLVMLR